MMQVQDSSAHDCNYDFGYESETDCGIEIETETENGYGNDHIAGNQSGRSR
jgi:hypothetical protein